MSYCKIFKKIIIVFIYALCVLLFTEGILRLAGNIYAPLPKPGQISEGAFNIVCFGDSFTYGWGVDAAQTYPRQLEKLLSDNELFDKKVRVFNLGVPGSNSSQILKYLYKILSNYKKPEIAIILTGVNDSWNFAESNLLEITRPSLPLTMQSKAKILLAKAKIYKLFKIIKLNLKGKTLKAQSDPFKIIPKYESVGIDSLKKLLEYNLTKMIKVAHANGVCIILHSYPRGDPYGGEIGKSVADRFSVPFVDNTSLFEKKLELLNFADLFLYDNSHPNADGYKIIAEGLAKVIIEQMKNKKVTKTKRDNFL